MPTRSLSLLAPAAMFAAGVIMTDPAAAADDKKAVLETYVDIAHAGYEDSLITAKALKAAVDKLIANPSEATLKAARTAWIAARVPYMQTEAFRFGNAVVDDWEGQVNSWPLDEGLIDYVSSDYGTESDENPYYAVNVIANPILKIGGRTVDATKITKSLLSDTLQEIGDIEANVATGYHAIEFLLWGQDTHGTGPGAGERPASDYDTANCTHGHCERRGQYLEAATGLLVDDLSYMTAQWAPGGTARTNIMNGDPDHGLLAIITGMGSLSYGELAGERMKLGLLLHDPEEEQDCFSDNTYHSHYYDALGIRNVFTGTYKRADGRMVSGPGIDSLLDDATRQSVQAALDTTMAKMTAMVTRAEKVEAYDQMIGEGNDAGNQMVQDAIDALLAQTKEIQRAAVALHLANVGIEGSDSLDDPKKVLQ